MKIYRSEESSLYQGKKKKDIHKRTYIQKKKKKEKKKKKKRKKNTPTTDIHNNKKLRNLYTGNIHPIPTHMIAEPFDSSVRMK